MESMVSTECENYAGSEATIFAPADESYDLQACPKCGITTRSWGRSMWRDGLSYCKDCLQEAEQVFVAENSCMACDKLMQKTELRACPPERIQQRDEMVRTGKVAKRYVCRPCFEMMTKRKFGVFLANGKYTRTPLAKKMSVLLGIGARA